MELRVSGLAVNRVVPIVPVAAIIVPVLLAGAYHTGTI